MDLAKKILKALEDKTEIDYCGLYENEVLTIINNELKGVM
jgi:hypothetical protein